VDSSRLAEHLDPEAMHEVMDGALRLMAKAVHRYEGTVNQFLGDGSPGNPHAPRGRHDRRGPSKIPHIPKSDDIPSSRGA
jgi:class 3 adenylate cyclase